MKIVQLDEIRRYINDESADNEEILLDMEKHAHSMIADILGRHLDDPVDLTETIAGRSKTRVWMSNPIRLLQKVEYRSGTDWTEQDLANFMFDNMRITAIVGVFPAGADNVRITYEAGLDAPSASLKGAVLSMVAWMYRNRLEASGGSDRTSQFRRFDTDMLVEVELPTQVQLYLSQERIQPGL